MPLTNRHPLHRTQHSGKRAGLPKPSSHGRVTTQKFCNLGARQASQDEVPFLKNWAQLLTVPDHPTPQIPAGHTQDPGTATEFGSDFPILSDVRQVNPSMRGRPWHPTILYSCLTQCQLRGDWRRDPEFSK
ncbi:MAG TPA: hypothetical protein VJS65_09800 [Verrucomicrobiae bacterium]|nr:hypothetical protein [Verrucomicrobiae bacterium]